MPFLALGCTPTDQESEERIKADRSAATAELELPVPPPRPSGPQRLTWTGCDISRKAYVADCVARYAQLTGIELVVTGGGATRGIRATVGGMTDLGGTCRHALPARYPEEEGGAVLTHVAWDAIVFFSHLDNPVDSITSDQARAVLLGRIRNWSELGGPDATIILAQRRQTVSGKLSGVGYMTRLLLFGDEEVEYTRKAIFYTSSDPVEEFVEATPHAFAVTGVSSARKRRVKILALEGIQPTSKNVASGAYPLFRPLYLVSHGPPEGQVKDFIDWVLGEEGQSTLSRAGTVSLAEGEALLEKYHHWPQDGVVRRKF